MLAKFLRWWHRRPGATHWSVVIGIALVAALLVAAAQRRAENAALAWGEPVAVLQAQRQLAAGSLPGVADVAVIEVPEHLVPQQALVDPSQLEPLGRAVPQGALLTAGDLRELSVISPGRRGIEISVSNTGANVNPGAHVELLLFAEIDPFDPVPEAPPQSVLAVVAAVEEDDWVVSIAPVDVDAVARAAVSGVIIPVLLS